MSHLYSNFDFIESDRYQIDMLFSLEENFNLNTFDNLEMKMLDYEIDARQSDGRTLFDVQSTQEATQKAEYSNQQDYSSLMVSQIQKSSSQTTAKSQMVGEKKQPTLSKYASTDAQNQGSAQSQNEEKCEQSYNGQRKTKKVKKTQVQKPGYPTKNFLVQFKKVQFEEIQNAFGQEIFDRYPWLVQIKRKNGINMKDYQRIYGVPEFQKIFASMFSRNVLFRSLMTSRCNAAQKKFYVSRIFRFQEAFKSKKFDRIN